MSDARDELSDEPALRGSSVPDGDGDPNGVWDEPALAAAPAAAGPRARHSAWIAAQWAEAGRSRHAVVFLAAALAAGPFAIVCAFFHEATAASPLGAVLFAPVAEELAKIAVPLMTLEKRPWAFSSGGAIAVLCAVSGLVFATIENLLYLFVYLSDPSPGIVIWRLVVCTGLHVSCATLSGLGLARVWRHAATAKTMAMIPQAASWFVAAILVHATYNGLALVWELLEPFRS